MENLFNGNKQLGNYILILWINQILFSCSKLIYFLILQMNEIFFYIILGDELNKFLNDNHAELKSDFAPIFENVIQEIVKNLMQQTLGHLHYKDVILS